MNEAQITKEIQNVQQVSENVAQLPRLQYWTRVAPESLPLGEALGVMAWASKLEFPCPADYDHDEGQWNSKIDGAVLDGVTHWMYYLPPDQPSIESVGAWLELAPAEIRMLQAYRESDDRARDETLGIAVRHADDWPRDWITIPVDLEEPQRDTATLSDDATPPAHLGAPIEADPSKLSLDAALSDLADESDNIDCSAGLLNDLLQVAINECGNVGDAASYVDTTIRAACRYLEDISAQNRKLQRYIAILEGKAK